MNGAEGLKQDLQKLVDSFLQQTGIPNGSINDKRLLEMYTLSPHPNVEYKPMITVKNFNGLVNVQGGRQIKIPYLLPEDEFVVSIEPILENEGIKENYGCNDQIIMYEKLRLKMITNYGRCFISKFIYPTKLPKGLRENSPGVYGDSIYKNKVEVEDADRLTYKLPSLFLEFLDGYMKKNTTQIQNANEKFYKLIGQFTDFLTDDCHIDSSKLTTRIENQKTKIHDLNSQIKSLQTQLQQKDQANSGHSSHINKLEGELSGFKITIQNMEKVITDLRFQINNSQQTIQTLEHKIKEKDATLADYEAYMRVKRKQNME
jgi:hypothetical protein